LAGAGQRALAVTGVLAAEDLQRRQRAVALAEALHAAALLVDADQLRARRGLADRLRQLGHLRARCEVAGEQDHAGAGVVLQPVALLRGEFGTGDADDEHGLLLQAPGPARSAPLHCEYGRAARARL